MYNGGMRHFRFRSIFALAVFISLVVPRYGAFGAAAGVLIKSSLSAVYYVTADGRRLAFPNEATYFTWYKDFSGVKTLSDNEVAALPLAGLVTVRPGAAPVRVESDNNIYAVASGGVLRPIQTAALAQLIYGDGWQAKTIVVPAAFFVSYKPGAPVTAGGQYWWRQEMDKASDIAHDVASVPSADQVSTSPAAPASVAAAFAVTPKTTTHKTINLAVGLWDPHDPAKVAATPTKDAITQLLFTGDKSVKGFYSEMSGGAVTLNEAGVFGWYDADKPASHYWATPDPTDADGDGYINGHNEKWAETILKMDKEFDFSAYDANHDGVLSPDELGVLIVIPTDSPFGTNRIVSAREFPAVAPMVVDGVKIGMIAEWYTGNPPNFGVVAHELSHLFFDTADMYADGQYRAGNFSLMDGSYCNCDIDPWQRLAGGKNWLNLLTPAASGAYELPAVDTSYSVMKIPRQNSDEFFLVENRETTKYNDIGTMPSGQAPGLLIWDIRSPSTAGDWGRNNIRLLRANGGLPLDDAKASYHGTAATPAATGILKWFDGSSSGVSLSAIGIAGATMKFQVNLNR